MNDLILNIEDRVVRVDYCLYCGSRDPCRSDRDTGFCNLYPLGNDAPCVTGRPVGGDSTVIEQMARAMAIADTGEREWLGAGEHWHSYEKEARKWLAAMLVHKAFND
jgi:hypothetical protein